MLYGAIAILLGCLVSGKLSSVWILVAGKWHKIPFRAVTWLLGPVQAAMQLTMANRFRLSIPKLLTCHTTGVTADTQ